MTMFRIRGAAGNLAHPVQAFIPPSPHRRETGRKSAEIFRPEPSEGRTPDEAGRVAHPSSVDTLVRQILHAVEKMPIHEPQEHADKDVRAPS